MTTVRVQLDLCFKFIRRPWTTVLVTIFLCLNPKHKRGYQKTCPCWKIHKNARIIFSKTAIWNHFVSLSTVCYWEENICKQIWIFYLLTVLLSIPLNKLPCPPPSSPPALVRSTYYNPPENATLIRLLQATGLNLLLYSRLLIFFKCKNNNSYISDTYLVYQFSGT